MDNLFLPIINGHLCYQKDEIVYSIQVHIPSLDRLLQNIPANELVDKLLLAQGRPVDSGQVLPNAPIGNQEVWGAGVTYKRSEEAREAVSGNSNIYTKIYHAQRPELFFKGLGQQVVGPGEPVGIRFDAHWSVP